MSFLPRCTFALVLPAALLAAACGSSASGSPSPTPTPPRVAAAYCAQIDKCCDAASLPSGTTECSRAAMDAIGEGEGSPTDETSAEQACAAAIVAETTADFCADYGTKLAACAGILSAPDGADCGDAVRCADPAALCISFGASTASAPGGTCIAVSAGAQGSTPCVGTVTTDDRGQPVTVPLNPGEGQTTGFTCATADGLSCDPGTRTCVPLGTGTSCAVNADCAAGDACVETCVPRQPVGATCAADAECVAGAYCASGTGTCALQAADGALCTSGGDPSECSSGTCLFDECGSASSPALADFCLEDPPP